MHLMRASLAIAAIFFFSGIALSQEPTKYQIAHATGPCKRVFLNKELVPLGSFHFRQGEKYRGGPLVGYSIQIDGTVTDVKIIKPSGINRLDDLVLADAKNWKYKPRASKCGVLDTTIALNIEWR